MQNYITLRELRKEIRIKNVQNMLSNYFFTFELNILMTEKLENIRLLKFHILHILVIDTEPSAVGKRIANFSFLTYSVINHFKFLDTPFVLGTKIYNK